MRRLHDGRTMIALAVLATATIAVRGQAPAPAPAAAKEAPATLKVHLPAADAQLEIEDQVLKQTGLTRTLKTPPLEAGKTFTYVLKATWREQGQSRTRRREVKVQGGKEIVVDLREDQPTTAGEWVEHGERLTARGEFNTAALAFTEAIKLDSKLPEAYVGRANALNNSAHEGSQAALDDCNEAIRLRSDMPRAFAVRAWVYCHLDNQYEKALADCEEALRLDPKNALAYCHRAHIWWHREEMDRAFVDATMAIRLDPSLARAYLDRGMVYNNREDYDRAIEDFNTTIRLAPWNDGAYTSRAYSYISKNNPDQGIADATAALQINPKNAVAYNNRGWAYNRKRQYQRGIEDLNRAIELNPKSSMAHNNRGWAHVQLGYYDRGIADCTRAIELNPKNAWAYSNRGDGYKGKGDLARANADYAMARQLRGQGGSAVAGREPFVSRDGGFSIAMPGKPKEHQVTTAATGVGNVPVKMFLVDHGDTAYSVDYADLPAGAVILLNSMIDQAAARYQGRALVTKDLKLGEHEGKEAQFDVPGKNLSVRIRAYAVGRRQYRVMLAAPRDFLHSKEANQFFDSFKLLQ